MEVLKDISQLTKGCGVTFIKNDDFRYYEYLMVHPNRDTYFLFIDSWSQEVVRIYIKDLLSGDYYVGKYDQIFVMEKRKDFFRRMIKNCDKRHSLLFGLIHYWDYGACNLRPEHLFSSVDKAKEAILKVDKSRRVTILYE